MTQRVSVSPLPVYVFCTCYLLITPTCWKREKSKDRYCALSSVCLKTYCKPCFLIGLLCKLYGKQQPQLICFLFNYNTIISLCRYLILLYFCMHSRVKRTKKDKERREREREREIKIWFLIY